MSALRRCLILLLVLLLPLAAAEPDADALRAAARERGISVPAGAGRVAKDTPAPVANAPADAAPDVTAPPAPEPAAVPPAVEPAVAWLDRAAQLPRLGAALTTGTVAPRPLTADYRLRPGDRVRLVTWGGTALNEVVLVDGNGALAVPGFGAIPVAGRSQADAQQLLTELVRSHFKNAGAALGVEQAGAVAAVVAGAVARPGYHSLPPGASLLDALAAAGGVEPQGTLRAIQVTTPGAAGDPARVDLYAVAAAGQAAGLGPLPPGAVVFVPVRGPEVQVFGAVRRSAAIELLEGEPLAEALRLAGGLTAAADPAVLRLVREGDDGQGMRHLAAADLAQEPARDGDRLMVVERVAIFDARRTVVVEGRVRTPGVFAFENGMTVARLIALAGGPLPDANLERALVLRTRGTPATLDQGGGVDVPVLYDVVAPVAAATVLQPLDQLTVPAFPPREESQLVVTVRGAVHRPGPLPLAPGMTAQVALLLAGGVTADAQLDQADLVRSTVDAEGARTVERIALDLRALLGGQPGPALHARDEIVVRTRSDARLVITVKGEASNTGAFTVPNGTTIGQLITLAGGLTHDAFVGGIRLYRQSEKATAEEYLAELRRRLEGAVAVNKRQLSTAEAEQDTRALTQTIAQQEAEIARLHQAQATGRLLGIDFAGIVEGRAAADIRLQQGDVIEIPARPNTIRVFGEVMSPGSLKYEANIGVATAIARAGGYGQQADRKRVFVVRADGAVVATAAGDGTEWDGAKRGWVTTSLKTIVLKEGDAVIVPPDLTYKPSGLQVAKDITQILFQIAVTAATVVVITG